MADFLTRFAPSPTGQLHLGHAASAWHVWHAAARAGGRVLLRIEDIDTTRCRPEYAQQILTDLHWLGFDWPEPVRVQSEHFAEYERVVAQLDGLGLAYRCFLTRSDLEHTTPAPLDAEQEAGLLAAGKPFAWRLSLARARDYLGPAWDALTYSLQTRHGIETLQADPTRHGDIVIARKDSPSAYHIASTHDDAVQAITHVIRGQDLAEAVHIHTLIQVLMGWPQPVYQHHDLVMGGDGKRLAKSNGSLPLAQLRADGMSVSEIWRALDLADK